MKKILVPYDLSDESKRALNWAFHLGCQHGSEIVIAHVYSLDKGLIAYGLEIDRSEFEKKLREDLSKLEQEYKARHQGKLKNVKTILVRGEVAPSILKCIQDEQPDLVVVSTHGRKGIKHFFLGSVAEQIVRHSPTPVLVVRREVDLPLKDILIPVDFSDQTEESLLFAAEFIGENKVEVELFHCVSLPDIAFYSPMVGDEMRGMTVENLKKGAEEKIQDLVKSHPQLKAKASVSIGPPVDEICQKAKEAECDLIIIPTHGHGALYHFFMGSVAENVIRYAHTNVLSYCSQSVREHKNKAII